MMKQQDFKMYGMAWIVLTAVAVISANAFGAQDRDGDQFKEYMVGVEKFVLKELIDSVNGATFALDEEVFKPCKNSDLVKILSNNVRPATDREIRDDLKMANDLEHHSMGFKSTGECQGEIIVFPKAFRQVVDYQRLHGRNKINSKLERSLARVYLKEAYHIAYNGNEGNKKAFHLVDQFFDLIDKKYDDSEETFRKFRQIHDEVQFRTFNGVDQNDKACSVKIKEVDWYYQLKGLNWGPSSKGNLFGADASKEGYLPHIIGKHPSNFETGAGDRVYESRARKEIVFEHKLDAEFQFSWKGAPSTMQFPGGQWENKSIGSAGRLVSVFGEGYVYDEPYKKANSELFPQLDWNSHFQYEYSTWDNVDWLTPYKGWDMKVVLDKTGTPLWFSYSQAYGFTYFMQDYEKVLCKISK